MIPEWLEKLYGEVREKPLRDDEAKMRLAVRISEESCLAGGGPFGAVIVDREAGGVISIGANWVVPGKCSHLHAEMVAIWWAESMRKAYDLNSVFPKGVELISSCEPCVMCTGAILWAGIKRLVYGALEADAREAGFDEGPKGSDWQDYFASRGIEVAGGILREDARQALVQYKANGGKIYNAG